MALRMLSWAFLVRVLLLIVLFDVGARLVSDGSKGRSAWRRPLPRGPRNPVQARIVNAPLESKLSVPGTPFGHCWPSRADCEHYGLCEMGNPFEPRIDVSTLMACNALSTDMSADKQLQLYHVSKCGGTTINMLFKPKSKGGAGGLTTKGLKLLRHEKENHWDQKYKSPLRPNSSFIIGTIRNPFEFYVSFWSMFTLSKMKGTGDCLRGSAIRRGRYELFDNRGRGNVTQFRAWLHFLFVESCDECQLTMWRAFQALYIGAPGSCPSYDRMVRLENFYPMLTKALHDYEQYSPGTVNWEAVNAWEQERHNTIKDGPLCPHHCFYDAHTKALVELHDAPLLQKFGYSFDETMQRHGGAEACRNSPCYDPDQ